MLDMGGLSCPQAGRRVGCRSSRKDRTLAATRTASKNTNAISPQSGRISFAKIHEPLEVPNLLDLQVESFNWLVGNEIWQSHVDAALAEGRTDINTKSGLE